MLYVEPAEQRERPPGSLWPKTAAGEGRERPRKILVCDDEKPIVRLIQINLEREGYEVDTAFDGREGLEKIRTFEPDVVIMDVMMPYMDGLEVLRRVRKDPGTKDIPVIILTVKAQDQDVFDGYNSGADLYLTKPFDPMELVKLLA